MPHADVLRTPTPAVCSGIDGRPRSASVTALEEGRGLVVPRRAFRAGAPEHDPLALARFLRQRSDVLDVRHPGLEELPQHAVAARQMRLAGPLVGFTLDGADRAQRFLAACRLVAEATSFGGVHSTAERRARWSPDAVRTGSSASPRAARMPRTCSRTSSRRCATAEGPAGGQAPRVYV